MMTEMKCLPRLRLISSRLFTRKLADVMSVNRQVFWLASVHHLPAFAVVCSVNS